MGRGFSAKLASTKELVNAIRLGKFDLLPHGSFVEQASERTAITNFPTIVERGALQILLERVKSFWIEGVLEHSSATHVDLSKELRPNEVAYPTLLFSILIFGNQVGVQRQPIRPNWGINVSYRYAVRFGLLFFILFTITVAAFRWLYSNLLQGDTVALVPLNGLEIGTLMGIAAFFYYGGIELIHHYVLRMMLWQKGFAPLNIVPVLERASHLLFLSKAGGGYLFTHPLLQSYFASLPWAPMNLRHQPKQTGLGWTHLKAWRGTAIVSGLILLLIGGVYLPSDQ